MAAKKPPKRLIHFYPGARISAQKQKLDDLIRVYEDLESTLNAVRRAAVKNTADNIPINVKKLVRQLLLSKQRLEQKIGNTVLLEKAALRKQFSNLSRRFTHRSPRA